MLSLLYLVVKAQHYFVTSSYMFLDEKTVLEIWLNPWLNLTIFRGTGPWVVTPMDLATWNSEAHRAFFGFGKSRIQRVAGHAAVIVRRVGTKR